MKRSLAHSRRSNTASDWEARTFGECAELVRDAVEPKEIESEPYIGLEHIGEGSLHLLSVGSSKQVTSLKTRFYQGDILFGKLRPYFRKIVRPLFGGVCSTDIFVVRPRGSVDSRYLFYYMAQPSFVEKASRAAEGTKMPRAKWEYLQALDIRVPPLAEQQAIARVLGSLDDKIELNRRMNQTLEEICRALYKFWFVDFGPVRAKLEGRWKKGKSLPGMPADMWDLWPSEFEESEIGEIPKGWKVVRLSDRFTTQYGYTAAASQEEIGPHLLRVTDINKSHWIDWSSVPYCSISAEELGRYSLCEGDLVVARMADPGKAAIVEGEPSAVFASYLVRLKNDSLARAYYTFYFLGSDSYLEYAEGARSGSVQANMNARVIVDVPYIDPPRPILDAFLDRVLPFRRRITANLIEDSTLATARDALLPKLLSGEVRVKVDS